MKLSKTSIINVYGDEGVGKSTLVQEVGYNLVMRNSFKDGIYYFQLKELP